MKKLNVLGLKVSVKIKAPCDPSAEAEWHPLKNEIVINPEADEKFSQCMHELFHAVWTRSGAYQTGISGETEEMLCEAFANVVTENIVTLYQMHKKLGK